MAKYKVVFPFVDDMGSIDPIIVSPSNMETSREQALWHLNKMREHDCLKPLDRLPVGTKFEEVF